MVRESESDQPLRGMRVLVAEDEFLIAVTVEEALQDAGAEVLRASTLSGALKVIQEEASSAAILDFRMGRETSEAVADALADRSIPFVFYSGQALPDHVRDRHRHVKLLIKPIKIETLILELRAILRNRL